MVKYSIVACMLAASTAHADSEAARLFEEGRAYVEQGNLVEACQSFTRSYELERAAGTALNVAECEDKAGNWEYALELYESAAKLFADSGSEVRAKFARERAAKLRAAHAPKSKSEPARPTGTAERPSKLALGIGIGGLAVGVIGTGVMVIDRGTIRDFEDETFSGAMVTPMQSTVTENDCGKVTFSSADLQSKFEASCAADQRARWLIPVTGISAAVGIGSLAYYVWTRRKASSSVAVTPTASGGVMATFEW